MSTAATDPVNRGAATTLVSGDVRRHNLAIVTRFLVSNGPSSRSQISDGTGLTRGTVTALAAALTDAGIVRESGPIVNGTKGRPLTLLKLAADDMALLALQLDADQATALVVSLAGETLFRHTEQHGRPMGRPDVVLDVAARVLKAGLDATAALQRRIADLTVVVFAPVGGEPAQVLADTDLGWDTVDVIGGLRARNPDLPPTVRLSPDASVAALAEHSKLTGVRDMLYLKSNSGIGGALIVAGRLVEGAHGFAGALGHLPIDHDGALCLCGQHGCLVTVAGPDVVLAAAGLGENLERDGLTAALTELTRRIRAGEKRATAAWDDAAVWVARALQILTISFDPEVIVLGGYWADLVEPVRRAFVRNHPTIAGARLWTDPQVMPGQLGDDAALLGTVWIARDRLLEDPLNIAI
ncbi:ROK family protein [Saxibacter everestensis]|uniref:ROK family protein n=1 Tax=Saxibacter everestensis TaxID=2909229 RepID=A0ABY8QTZ2_9MICO|nr:ROK family protein [Brevibacteriaceae bacterium ZFBP1038]